MSPFSLIPLFALLVHVAAMSSIATRDHRQPTHRAYLLFGTAAAFWMLGDLILLNSSGDVSWPFDRLVSLGWMPMGLLFLEVVHATVARRRDWVWWLAAAGAAAALVVNFSTDLISQGYQSYWYGTDLVPGPLYGPVIGLVIILPGAWALALAVREARRRPHLRASMLFLNLGMGTAFVLGIITDVLLPLTLGDRSVPSLASSGSFFVSLFVFVSLVQQGALVLSPRSVARDLFEHISDAVLVIDAEDTIQAANPAARQLFGRSVRGALLGSLVASLPPEEEAQDHETRLAGKDPRVLSLSRTSVRTSRGTLLGHVVVLRDLTQRQEAQAEMNKRQRLESVGVLAGGIAHDFNNALLTILGNVDLMERAQPEGQPESSGLQEIKTAARRARHLTQQLLSFSKGGAPIRKPVLIDELLEQSTELSLGGAAMQATTRCEPLPGYVLGDAGQLVQVFSNLLINARDAGATTVRILAEPSSDPAMGYLDGVDYVRVLVEDDGHGIAPELRGRIFDPYYTTREQGSGLGLASVFSIVKRHEGAVRVGESSLGGACLEVWLPLTDHSPLITPRAEAVEPSADLRVLLMDDDRAVRRVATRLLERLGYEATAAEHGEEAVKLYAQAMARGRPFHVVILDLTVMGGMGGLDTVTALLELDPSCRAVVSSGYSDDPAMGSPTDYGFCGVLSKPYAPEDMAEAVELAARGA